MQKGKGTKIGATATTPAANRSGEACTNGNYDAWSRKSSYYAGEVDKKVLRAIALHRLKGKIA